MPTDDWFRHPMQDTFCLSRQQASAVMQMLAVSSHDPSMYLPSQDLTAFMEATTIMTPAHRGDGSTAISKLPTVGYKIIEHNEGHTRISVWIGRTYRSRANSGHLTLRSDELLALDAMGWENITDPTNE